MACFEDAGYFCVDNLPPELMRSITELFAHEGHRVERAAIVCDVRGGQYFDELERALEELGQAGTPHRLLFLEAADDVLIDRYKETRRRHPLAPNGQVKGGIEVERELLEPLKERADVRIDTTDLTAQRLRRVIADKMLPRGDAGKMAITFLTYGYKHGAPREVDLAFDVRFLPNPYYEPHLRYLTGQDSPVIDYVNATSGIEAFYERLVPLLDYLLPAYLSEGKAHLTVGIGCTGGRHRSVVIAEHLAGLYGERDEFAIEVIHRDVDKPPRRP